MTRRRIIVAVVFAVLVLGVVALVSSSGDGGRRHVAATVTPSTTTATVASAGSTATTSTLTAQPLAGKIVVLDPGHNEHNVDHPTEINRLVGIGNGVKACDTTGSETNAGYAEAAFTTDVAGRVTADLRRLGASVVLTRDAATPWGPCITERAAIGNRAHADAAVSIHADGGPTVGRGFHVIQPGLVAGYNDQIIGPSHRLALSVHEAYLAATGLPPSTYIGRDGYDTRTDLGGLNLSAVPKVFIECGNMRNATDAALLSDPAFRDQVARGIATGIADFLTQTSAGFPRANRVIATHLVRIDRVGRAVRAAGSTAARAVGPGP